tara:strand:- start:842 stop:1867 length:1026 start_codon:yes stop_codon:yes gene_type:complete
VSESLEPESFFRKVFRDISRGFTKIELEKKTIYIKHLSQDDQVELDDIEDEYLGSAKKRGLPSEQEMLDLLKEQGVWGDKDEDEIAADKLYLQTLTDSKRTLVLKSHIDRKNEQIHEAEKDLEIKLRDRLKVLGNTAEKYAKEKTNDHYIIRSFFRDAELEDNVFTEKDFWELDDRHLQKAVIKYNDYFGMFSEANVRHLCLQDFYYSYFPFSESPVDFFGESIVQLTYNQLRLIVYTKIFKNIFERNENIPQQLRKDPDALLDYGNISEKTKEKIKDKMEVEGATSFVGATQEDLDYLSLREKSEGDSVRTVSLTDEAKKKGGSLNMDDLMRIQGMDVGD